MARIQLANLHDKLAAAGIPIDGIALDRPAKPGISIDYQSGVTDEQKVAAEAIVAAYDQDAEDAAKAARSAPVTAEEIESAKTIADLKALLHRMRTA